MQWLPELLLARILLRGVVKVTAAGKQDHDEYGCAPADRLMAVKIQEIERFLDFERNIILLQFFTGEMGRHENLLWSEPLW